MTSAAIAKRAALAAGVLLAGVGCASAWTPLRAQAVVQQLPPREAAELNAALRKLATRPTDLDALLSAGNASLALHDAGAAAGFFARAAKVAPGDARVLVGKARVALEQRRPVEALTTFAQAERAGARSIDIAADRALAYDLVGDNASAQNLYRSVLAVGDSAEVRRRLALSLAIAGNRTEFERTLYPLLKDEDRSAFRTRAFGLAILGRPDDAVEIADAMMPTDLALRMAPYLRYMPRLTKSQQAAAGNLGAFPAAADIGRDSPDIAGYAGAGARIAANASTALTPQGAPLGPRTQAPGRSQTGVTASPPSLIPSSRTGSTRETVAVVAMPERTPAPTPVVAQASPIVARTVASSTPAAAVRTAPVVVAAAAPAPAPERPSLGDAFADLDALPSATSRPAAGAVDIAALAPARKAAPAPAAAKRAARESVAKPTVAVKDPPPGKPKPEAKKPAEPARIWLQVGVGRNTGAFAFDWKKLAKQAGGALDGKGPWAVKYGASNRMLAGPFATDAAAKAALKRLKDKDIEALPFTSDEGEKVIKIG